jgi:His Kinase A (phospho-acceptor) domain
MRAVTLTRIKVNWLVVGTVVLASLLVFAAIQQYRWINRASETDRRQHREYIETTLRNFSVDFRESILSLLPVFRPLPTIPSATSLETYLKERAAQWRDNSDRPQMIGSVSFAAETPSAGVVFKRLRAGEDNFTEQSWPEELMLYRTILEERLRMPGGEPPLFPNGFAFELSEGRPVLVFPLVTNEEPPAPPPPLNDNRLAPSSSSERERTPPPAGALQERRPPLRQGTRELMETMRPAPPRGLVHVLELQGWCFLELDLDYLQKHLLPELVSRHYGQSVVNEYKLAVVTRRPLRIIYQSDTSTTPESFSRIDAGILLFDSRTQPNRPGPPPAQQQPPPPGEDVPLEEPPARPQPPPPPPPPNQAPPPFIAGRDGAPLNAIDVGRPENKDDDDDAWLLVIKSASGSLDTEANHLRLHNLTLNFSILVILVGSLVMLMLANARQRRLARQQMEFVAGVSHELRTPLTVIQSTSYNLSKGMIQDNERVRKYGDVIQGEARRLINQVEQMLSFAGIQSGRQLYDMRAVDLALIIERALAEYAAVLDEGHWQVEKEVDEDLPFVLADAQARLRI